MVTRCSCTEGTVGARERVEVELWAQPTAKKVTSRTIHNSGFMKYPG
jgi:hypothetical protein